MNYVWLRMLIVGASCGGAACGAIPVSSIEDESNLSRQPLTHSVQVATHRYPEVGLLTAGDRACTGTLIASDVVLTAAHCLAPDPNGTWLPMSFRGFGEPMVGSREVIAHPQYFSCNKSWPQHANPLVQEACRKVWEDASDSQTWFERLDWQARDVLAMLNGSARPPGLSFAYDVAVIILEKPVSTAPVTLWTNESGFVEASDVVEAVGFGFQHDTMRTGNKHWGLANVVDVSNEIVFTGRLAHPVSWFSNSQALGGDSGGPLFISVVGTSGAVHRIQVGVAESRSKDGTRYSRVDLVHPWIAERLANRPK